MLRIISALSVVAFLAGCVNSSVSSVPGVRLSADAHAAHCPAYRKGSGLLPDGDFQQAIDPGTYYKTFSKGQKLAPHWKVTVLNINFVGTKFWNFDHLCSVDLDGESAVGGIENPSFPTKKGAAYVLSFLLSGNSYCASTTKKMRVSVGNKSVLFKWLDANGHSVQYGIFGKRSLKFNATNSTSTLKFTSLDPPHSGCGPVVGGISVTAA
ncbi:MAG TPA: DUF642 domain-containing protein [Candidatus Binatia bacterium]|nr:DUF642 domain-containing protein [Candidatus Binatia bacterium]